MVALLLSIFVAVVIGEQERTYASISIGKNHFILSNSTTILEDQIPCPRCAKPIIESKLMAHIELAHVRREELMEKGERTGGLHQRKLQRTKRSLF
jgi:deoxycytidylate deaminase